MVLKIKLNEEGLWVNKYKCKSVTIEQSKEGFKASLFHMEGITKITQEFREDGTPKLDTFTRKPIFKTLNLKKVIKSKSISYEGIPLSDGKCNHAVNKQGDYVNLYYLQNL